MHLYYRNVNDAFRGLVSIFQSPSSRNCGVPVPKIVRKPSRVGEVLTIQEPVTITYTHPRERVLFNQARDANCFFHLYESLWMLAGRNDIAPLDYYSSGYSKQVDDGNGIANGAYGDRWRHAETFSVRRLVEGDAYNPSARNGVSYVDQIKLLIQHLKEQPNSRRAVLNMWNVEDDLLKIGDKCPVNYGEGHHTAKGHLTTGPDKDWVCETCNGTGLVNYSKDVCCNLNVMFSLREGADQEDKCLAVKKWLDMTVTNRSNDMIWGSLGANVVHFSFLQEYMAQCLGVEVGQYHQFSNNLHVYTERFEAEKWLADKSGGYARNESALSILPLVQDPATFDKEVIEFVELNKSNAIDKQTYWSEPFLREVAQPMCHAFHCHKKRCYNEAYLWCEQIKADDWRIVAHHWINKRKVIYLTRKERPEHVHNSTDV